MIIDTYFHIETTLPMKNENKYPVEGYSDKELFNILKYPLSKEYDNAFEKLMKAIQVTAYLNLSKESIKVSYDKSLKDPDIIERVIDKLLVKLHKEKGTQKLLGDYQPEEGSIVYYLGQIKFLQGRYINELNAKVAEAKKEDATENSTKKFETLLKEINTRKIIVVVNEKEKGKPYNINKQQIATFANYKPELIPHQHNSLVESNGNSLYPTGWSKLQTIHKQRLTEFKTNLLMIVKKSFLGQTRTQNSNNKQILKLMEDYKILKIKSDDFCELMKVSSVQAQKFRSNLRLNKYLIRIIS